MTERTQNIFNEYLNKKIIIEIKDGHKYFGTLNKIDNSPEHWLWIEIIDKDGNKQIFADSEIKRIEVSNE
jgi:small nuclear ribonucleoprotein (snRNP)-like protein